MDKILHLPRFNEMSVGFPDFIETNRIQSEIKVVTTSAKFSFVKEMILMEQRGVLWIIHRNYEEHFTHTVFSGIAAQWNISNCMLLMYTLHDKARWKANPNTEMSQSIKFCSFLKTFSRLELINCRKSKSNTLLSKLEVRCFKPLSVM